MIKAQVLAGGRGKGTFDNGFKGGVRVVYSPREAAILADQMIGHKLITKQTGAAGRLCNAVYIVERKFARREFYLAVLMDRASQGPVIVASSQGGMDIEAVAKEHPEAIITTHINIHEGVTDEIGGEDAVIKAQVLAGGRGKGTFDNGFKGGVRVVYSPREAAILADQMIGHKLITKQTGAAGRLCNAVYIVERKFARREFYLAVLMDRASQGPVIVASSQGGMDIEAVAKEHPEAIITTHINIHEGVTDEIARKRLAERMQ